MRRRRPRHARDGVRGLFALAGAAGAVALADVGFLEGRAALNLYLVPVLIGAAALGRRGGIYATVIALGVVGATTLLQGRLPAAPLDLAVWVAVMTATAWVVGSLQDRRSGRRRALRHAHQAIRDLLVRLVTTFGAPAEGHAWRVAECAVEAGRSLGMSAEELEALRAAGWLHELGDSESTLAALRRAAGAPEEDQAGFIERVIEILAHVHERWDGNGPIGLKGAEIPVAARILAVADAWDTALASPEQALPARTEAEEALRRGSGRRFDPDAVDALLRARFRTGLGAA